MNLLKTKDKTKQEVWLNVDQIVSFKKGSVSMVDGKVYHLPDDEFERLLVGSTMSDTKEILDKVSMGAKVVDIKPVSEVAEFKEKPKPQRKTTRKKAAIKRASK